MADDFLDDLLEPDFDSENYYRPKVQALSLEARKHLEADEITERILANCMQAAYSQIKDEIYHVAIGLDTWPIMANLSPYGKCIFDQIFGVSTDENGYLIDYPSLMAILETLEQLEIKHGASATSLELTDFVPYLSDSPIQLTVLDAELINATVEAMIKMKQIKDEVEKFDALGTRYSKIILLRHIEQFGKLIPTLFTEIDTLLESEESETIRNFLAGITATTLLMRFAEDVDWIADHPLRQINPQAKTASAQKARIEQRLTLARNIVFELYRYAIKISPFNRGNGDADEERSEEDEPIPYEDLEILPLKSTDPAIKKRLLIDQARLALSQQETSTYTQWLTKDELKILLQQIKAELESMKS